MPHTKAGFAVLFNDLARVYNGIDLGLQADDIQLTRARVGFCVSIGKIGELKIDLDRLAFERSMDRFVGRLRELGPAALMSEEPTA